jgi:ferric-dicitrate binding protein FerR (iron transport regulator)
MKHSEPEEKTEEASIERVLQAAGRRVQPSEELTHSVRSETFAEWKAVVIERRRQRRRMFALAAAASVALIAVAAWLGRSAMAPAPITVANIARVTGDVRIAGGWGRAHPAAAMQALHGGERLITGHDGRVALALATGVSVRVDHDTEIEFDGTHRASIKTGAVYVDSPGVPVPEQRLRIETPIGAVQHFGTQYEVRFAQSSLRVRVREGKVALTPDAGILQSGTAGEQLTVAADGKVDRSRINTHGAEWDWASDLAPTLDIDGRPLKEFLHWAARELGQTVEFATPESEAEAAKVVLSGSVDGLAPDDALDAVLSTTRLRHMERDGRIVVAVESS